MARREARERVVDNEQVENLRQCLDGSIRKGLK